MQEGGGATATPDGRTGDLVTGMEGRATSWEEEAEGGCGCGGPGLHTAQAEVRAGGGVAPSRPKSSRGLPRPSQGHTCQPPSIGAGGH